MRGGRDRATGKERERERERELRVGEKEEEEGGREEFIHCACMNIKKS